MKDNERVSREVRVEEGKRDVDPRSPLWAERLLLAFGVAVLGVSFLRIFLEIDLADEALFIALARRFAMGDRPFVDEQSLAQFSALLLWPVVGLYERLAGGADGIMLFSRFTCWLLSLASGAVAYLTVRASLSRRVAFLVALLPVVFVPHNILGLNYNTVPAHTFSMGLLLLFGPWPQRKDWRLLLAAGGLHATAALFHLGVVPALGVTAALLFVFQRPRRSCFFYLAPTVPVGSWLMVRLYLLGAPSSRMAGDRLGEIFDFVRVGYHQLFVGLGGLYHLWFLVAAVAAYASLRKPRWPAWTFTLITVAAVVFSIRSRDATGPARFMFLLGMLAPVFYLGLPRGSRPARFFWGVWVASLACSLLHARVSDNGFYKSGVGMLAGGVLCLWLFHRWARSLSTGASARLWGYGYPWANVIAVAALCGYLLFPQGEPFYRIARPVHGGPFAGLLTQERKASLLAGLRSDILPFESSHERITAYPLFPSIYLMSRMRPNTASVWMMECGALPWAAACTERNLPVLRRHCGRGTLFVRMYYHPFYENLLPRDAVDDWLDSVGEERVRKPDYVIYSLKCSNGIGP